MDDGPIQNHPPFATILAIMTFADLGSIMSTDLYAPNLPYLTDLMKLDIFIYGFA